MEVRYSFQLRKRLGLLIFFPDTHEGHMSLLPSVLVVLLALSVATSASSTWKGFFCHKNCTQCYWSFDYNDCWVAAGRYQNKNFNAYALDVIVSDTSKGFNFTVLFYDNDTSCSQPEHVVALIPGCPPDTCCSIDTVSLDNKLEFQAFSVLDWPESSPSPSPSPKPCDDDSKPPLWSIIVMAGLGGISAVLLVLVGLTYYMMRRRQYDTLN
jgi:hypothetical protein